jgi:hypothetical protein
MTRDIGLLRLFPSPEFIIGMIHPKGCNADDRMNRAIRETDEYLGDGVDAILVENYFASIPACETFLAWLQENRRECLYGVNILQNLDVSLGLAAKFVQEDSACGHMSG